MKVMIISPIRQNPEVLGLFLKSLSALAIQYRNQIEIAYYFADDNVERQSYCAADIPSKKQWCKLPTNAMFLSRGRNRNIRLCS